MLVYLFAKQTGRGPSFRVPSVTIASSQILISLIDNGPTSRMRTHSVEDSGARSPEEVGGAQSYLGRLTSSPQTSAPGPEFLSAFGSSDGSGAGSGESIRSFSDAPRETSLYFPVELSTSPTLTTQDIQRLVDVRNLFAFFTGQPLVATRSQPTVFRILLSIAQTLRKYEFNNVDGSTYGEAAASSFGFYVDDFHLADCTQSRERTIEGVILGEAMRSQDLYTEAFAHAVGKYAALTRDKSQLFSEISPSSRSRLERAALDLSQRQKSIFVRLNEFDFPSLFAGFASSSTTSESKIIRFKAWKQSYINMRRAVLNYYKDLHGQWPPKASSKKNSFTESGLNRLVLKGLYKDMCSLYDLLADRDSLTTRSYDAPTEETEESMANPRAAALRRIELEYDRSSPPVQPPVPFDTPRIPTMTTIEPKFPFISPKDQHKSASRRLQEYECLLLLAKSHNFDADLNLPFLNMYKAYEEREARGCSAREMEDQRYGHWLFLYATLQALPMLVVDAPELQFSEGVEYFLCEPPLGNLPWMDDAAGTKMAWYGIQGGQGVVSLPSDIVNHGVEATYRRSHCWLRAEEWITAAENAGNPAPLPPTALVDEARSPLDPPPGLSGELGYPMGRRSRERRPSDHSAGSSTNLTPPESTRRGHSTQAQRNSIAIGLERLPIPQGLDEPWKGNGSTPISMGGFSSRNASRATSRNASPSGFGGSRRMSSYGSSQPGSPSSATLASSNRSLHPMHMPGNRGSTFDDILGSGGGPGSPVSGSANTAGVETATRKKK